MNYFVAFVEWAVGGLARLVEELAVRVAAFAFACMVGYILIVASLQAAAKPATKFAPPTASVVPKPADNPSDAYIVRNPNAPHMGRLGGR